MFKMGSSSSKKQAALPDDMPSAVPKYLNRGRRGSVSSESTSTVPQTTEKKVVPKTEEEKARIVAALQKNVIFADCSDDQKTDIINAMFSKKVATGESIIKQGDDGDFFYVVESGKFDIFVKKGDAEAVRVVQGLGQGGSFGELALMYNAPRAATVTALEDSVVWAVDRVTFRVIIQGSMQKRRGQYESFLENVPLLKTLNKIERLTIADALIEVNYEDNQEIIKQGERGFDFFLLQEGEATAWMKPEGDDTAEAVEVKKYGMGDYFGELAIITDQPRAATIRAKGKVKCAKLERDTFLRLLGPLSDILKREMSAYQTYEQIIKTATIAPAPEPETEDDE